MGEIRAVSTCASAWIGTRFAWTQRWETLFLQSLHHYYAPDEVWTAWYSLYRVTDVCILYYYTATILHSWTDAIVTTYEVLHDHYYYYDYYYFCVWRVYVIWGCLVEVQHTTYITAHIVSRFHRRIDWPRDSGLTLIHLLVEAAAAVV